MPRPRLAMRKVRDILRLAHAEGLALRQVGAALGVPFTTVGDHLRRAERAGLTWPLPAELDDTALEALLFPKGPAPEPNRPMPDWKHVHKELKRKGVTLMLLWLEYREDHPDGYSYSQFCHRYRAFQAHIDLPMRQEHRAGEKLFVDFPGQRLPIYDRRSGEALRGRAVRGRARRVELPPCRGDPAPGTRALGERARARLRGTGPCSARRRVRQPPLGCDPRQSLRARRQRHLFGATSKRMDLAISFTFTEAGSGTLVHGTFDPKPKGVMAVLFPLLRPMIRRDMAKQHQQFKALCESQAQSPST